MGNQFYQPVWVREDFIDFIAEKFHPTWAWKRVKASLLSKHALSPDFSEFTLRPNQNFQKNTYKAGQSILLTLTLAGVRQQRSYSIVKQHENGDVTIAVKKQGSVSTAIHQLSLGSIIEISQPQGHFIIQDLKQPALMVASGSGITAIYAQIEYFLAKSTQKIDLVYFHRDHAYVQDFEKLAQRFPQFHFHSIYTLEQKQHLDLDLFNQYVPDFQQRLCYGCGTAAMIGALQNIYQTLNLQQQLSVEYFRLKADPSISVQTVKFLRSQRVFEAQASLLESAEKAGLKPASGCRMGICNTCSCTKVEGAVKNMLTGEIDQQTNTQIKLCISQAVSPVTINL